MNYYEELGLAESASVEEIRQSYKSLVRLLHPDHQSEEPLRKVAELQLTRLNEIVAVLTDPLRREKYDASIHAVVAKRPAEIEQEMPAWKGIRFGRIRLRVGTIVWSASLVVAAVVFSFALLYFEHGAAVPVYEGNSSQQTRPSPSSMPTAPPARERAAAHPGSERPAKPTVQVDKGDPPLVATEPSSPSAQRQYPPPASQLTATTALPPTSNNGVKTRPEEIRTNPNPPNPDRSQVEDPVSSPLGPNVQNRESASRGPWVGTWLYSKSSTNASGNLAYRPEYIEMIVKPQESGKISGRYLGRYQVPDQALSSEVRFAFEGAIGDGTTLLPWRSSDGAEGQVRMKIVSDGSVEVTWYTTRFGTSRKLASGTAVLRRN